MQAIGSLRAVAFFIFVVSVCVVQYNARFTSRFTVQLPISSVTPFLPMVPNRDWTNFCRRINFTEVEDSVSQLKFLT